MRANSVRPEHARSVEERVRARRLREDVGCRAQASCDEGARQHADAHAHAHAHTHEGEGAVPPAPLFDAPVTLEDDERLKRAERAEREEERARRSVKDVVLDKTPQRLRNPSNIQVRFRTGFV